MFYKYRNFPQSNTIKSGKGTKSMNRLKAVAKVTYVGMEATLKGIKGFIKGYGNSIQHLVREQTLVLIANGPSLNQTRLDGFTEDLEYACVNFFPGENEFFFTLKPKYLCLFDPVFWEPNIETKKEQLERTFRALEKADWKLIIVTCIDQKLPIVNPHIEYQIVSPIQLVYKECRSLRHFLHRKNLVNLGAQNVVTGSLYYFINTGYKKIYLAGLDMSEFKNLYIDSDNNILVKKNHSYSEKEQYVNFLDSGIVKKGEFYILLKKYCKMFEEFYLIADYAKEMGTEIINLNPESYVDVFDKSSKYRI